MRSNRRWPRPIALPSWPSAGARVIKIERPEGDFARGYDLPAVARPNAYFVWLNRGKQSVALDLAQADDLVLARNMIANADACFVQNLAPPA